MASGFCPAVLGHLASVAGENYPGRKVTIPGLTKKLIDQQSSPDLIVGKSGHNHTVNLKYLQRGTPNSYGTSAGCTVDYVPAFKETTVPLTKYIKVGIFYSDAQIRQYCEEYSQTVAVGQPATQMMNFVMESLLAKMNTLYQGMELILMTKLGLNLGVHKSSGTAAAVTLNIKQDNTVNDLSSAGIAKLLVDAANNEIEGTPEIIFQLGSKFHTYNEQLKARALGMNTAGVDASKLADALGYVPYASDKVTAGIGGADNIVMVAPGMIHLIENLQFEGAFAGTRGTSTFGTLVDPRVHSWGGLPVKWDFQAKYIDCAEDVATAIGNGYINANTLPSERGMLLIVSKVFDLFSIPNDAYEGGDRISGGGRPLLYNVTNT